MLAYIRAYQRGDWKGACSLQNRELFAASHYSVAACAKSAPSRLNDGNGFYGFIYRGTATVRAMRSRLTGSGRASVYVLWRVYPWRRDAVQVYLMDREYADGQEGRFRISDQRWARPQKWPPY